MLTKSPWASRVKIALTGFRRGGRRPLGSGRDSGSGGYGGAGSQGPIEYGGARGAGSTGSSRAGRRLGGSGTFRPSLRLTIRWNSALPIQQALAKTFPSKEIHPPESQPVGEIQQKRMYYVIEVSGLPPRMFRRNEDRLQSISERLKSASFLKIHGHDPTPAEAVHIRPNQGTILDIQSGQVAGGFLVLFPRGRNGSHLITLEDKRVEFVTKMGPLEIKRKFKLKNMVYNGKLAL